LQRRHLAVTERCELPVDVGGDLLGGVMVIKGKFADGSPMIAIPNYARMNREPAPPPRPAESAPAAGDSRAGTARLQGGGGL